MSKILAIGAHPDDIELGCAGTLLKHKENDDDIFLLILTKGEASGDPEIRWKECLESAKCIGVKHVYFGDLEDTKIGEGFDTIKAIERKIYEVKPDIIYTHSYKDTHQDHRNTGYATLSAARRSKKILTYESPTTFKEFSPHIYIDIKGQFQRKKEIIRIFTSQSNKYWWSMGDRAATALEGLASYRGFQAGLEVAEAFELFRMVINGDEYILNPKTKKSETR